MSEACPLQSALAHNMVIFNPEIVLGNNEENLQKKFKSSLQHPFLLWILSSHESDKALIQYGNVKEDPQEAAID